MELIPINDSKLKIMLDVSDMKEYNIGEDADCASNETRHAIRSILDRARAQIGFNTEGSEIFVQLYTSKSGGCELFITKGEASSPRPIDQKNEKKGKKRSDTQKPVPTECRSALSVRKESLPAYQRSEYQRLIFSFDSLKELSRVCKILCMRGIKLVSHVYCGEKNEFFLILDNTGMSAYSQLDRLTFIMEFGKRVRHEHISTYLSEYGRLICRDNAVETLSKF